MWLVACVDRVDGVDEMGGGGGGGMSCRVVSWHRYGGSQAEGWSHGGIAL